MAKIFLSVPILGRPELQMIYSMYRSILSTRKHQIRLYFNSNDSLISRVRNVHISLFLHQYTECDYFMSWDSDIETLNTFVENNIFDKLIEHDKDFIGGLYAVKKPGSIKCSSISMNSNDDIQFNSGIIPMRWLSSGCWMIKRSAVEKMANAYPELIYDGDDNASGHIMHGLYIPFIYEMTPEEFPNIDKPFKKYLSEDWACCARWRKIGGEIWADTSIVLKHYGSISYDLFNVELQVKHNPPPAGYDLNKKEQ